MANFSDCGDLVPCSAFFDKNSKFTSVNYYLEKIIELDNEKKKYFIEPVSVFKGTIVVIEIIDDGKIATVNLDKSTSYGHSDYSFSSSEKSVTKLENENSKQVFLLNSIIEHGHYFDIIPVIKSYPLYFTYFTKIKLANSSINIKARLDVINGYLNYLNLKKKFIQFFLRKR